MFSNFNFYSDTAGNTGGFASSPFDSQYYFDSSGNTGSFESPSTPSKSNVWENFLGGAKNDFAGTLGRGLAGMAFGQISNLMNPSSSSQNLGQYAAFGPGMDAISSGIMQRMQYPIAKLTQDLDRTGNLQRAFDQGRIYGPLSRSESTKDFMQMLNQGQILKEKEYGPIGQLRSGASLRINPTGTTMRPSKYGSFTSVA